MRDAAGYIDEIKSLLISLVFVADFEMLREETLGMTGLYRLRARLDGGSVLEMFEYFQVLEDQTTGVGKYSFHWQNSDGGLIRRWDNAPHHPEIPSFPNHVHHGATGEVSQSPPVSGVQILKMLEMSLDGTRFLAKHAGRSG